MPIQKAGEGEYTISMGGVTVLFGVKGDVFYCTTDAVVKSALDGADIESLASMSKIFKGQSGSFYVDFEGVTALTAQLAAWRERTADCTVDTVYFGSGALRARHVRRHGSLWYDEGRDCRNQYDGQGAEFL